MNFLAPGLLFGLLAAAIPPLIHLIHRRKAVTVRFAALEFVLRANKKTARRFKAKQWLLIALRSLLLAGLAFALAQPILERSDAVALTGDVLGTTVIVVDASYPMGYTLDGETLLDRARRMGAQALDHVRGQAAVLVAGDRVEAPVAEPTTDLASCRRALDPLKVGSKVGTLSAAVAQAYEVLSAVREGGRGRVVVLTTRAGIATLPAPPSAAGEAITLVPVDVSEGAPVGNYAVLDVRLRPAPAMGDGQWRVDARIGNFSADAVARMPVNLEIGGVVTVRGFLDLAAGAEGVKTFYARLDTRAPTPAAVVLSPDALPSDDRRDFWLQPAPKLRVLAVNGDPHPTPHRDELFYLARALAPTTTAGARVRLTTTSADTFDRHPLDEVDVVVLANVAELTDDRAEALVAFVQGGGGLFITMGGQVQPSRANAQLGRLLPRTLRSARQAGDAAASVDGGDRRRAHLTTFDRSHPLLRPFDDPASGSLAQAQISRYMLLDPAPGGAGEVVATLSDGAPFLLTRPVGRGRVVLMCGSLDRDWGDLPIRADFLPLMQQILRYLTRVAEVETTPVLVGQPAPVPVEDPRVQRVVVEAPDGLIYNVERPKGDVPWTFDETIRPGHYAVRPDPPLPGLLALPGFAVALDPAGADLRGPVAPDADGEAAVAAALNGDERTELWHAALFALFVLLLAEGLLLFKRGPVLDPNGDSGA